MKDLKNNRENGEELLLKEKIEYFLELSYEFLN